jgi:ubiquinone/menaquinone biosynthesis C-methylase UbiE
VAAGVGARADGAARAGHAGRAQIAHELLELGPGDTVLDIACRAGNFVREFAGSVGKRGLVVGLDASQTMLARAVEDTGAESRNVAYVRGDAIRCRSATAASTPSAASRRCTCSTRRWPRLDAMQRVLAPGGRVAILTSARAPLTPAPVGALVGAATGLRVFGRDEITGALEERGFEGIQRRISGLAQFVGARKGGDRAAA